MLSVKNLTKIYKLKKGGGKVVALNKVSIDFPDTGLVFLLGKSGSGKSTLLNSIGGLDTFDGGEIVIKGKSSKDFKQSDFDSYRNTFIGFIFQEYNILEEFSIGKNLALALELQGKKAGKRQVENLLEEVDLQGFYKRKPNQLSGGQKQRVAIARALIKDPEIIMADEPTGALDSNTGKQVMDTLKKLSKTKLVIIVSHDREFAEVYGDRIVELKDGQIVNDRTKKEVIAEKTKSGVSFIDNKIIHIKKSQSITKDDLIRINKMIVNNVKQGDTIISLDEKSNMEVKRASAITNDGNREVFKETLPDDIKQEPHNPKDFKLIKSRLKGKDSFKIGASSLKHKPIRLIFTILLASIAFCLFGLVDTLACFNRATSVCETLDALGVKTYAINKNIMDDYGYVESKMPFTKTDLEKLTKRKTGHKFQEVIASGCVFEIRGEADSYNDYYSFNNISNESKSLKQAKISGITPFKADTLQNFNLKIEYEYTPTSTKFDGIYISYNMYKTILERVSSIESWDQLKGKTIRIQTDSRYYYSGEPFEKWFTIVGVIKDDTDISKYETDNSNQPSSNNAIGEMIDSSEIETILNYGLINMCYVSEETYTEISAKYSPSTDLNYSYKVYGDSYYGVNSGAIYNYTSISSMIGSNEIKMKEGYNNASNLTGNQAVVGKWLIERMFVDWNDEMTIEEIQQKIDAGLTITFNLGYTSQKAFEVEVVGFMPYIYSSIIVSNELKGSLSTTGADYVITRALGTSADKSLINYVENYNKNSMKYTVQFASTAIFDNFGGMINSMKNPLLYVGIGVAVFAGLMLMNFIAVSISYKKREIGVLRAIGARGKDVFMMFFWEAFIICVINFAVASIGCGLACYFINRAIITNLGFKITLLSFGLRQLLLMFAVSFGVAVVSSFIPVYKIARKNPIDSINNR